MQFSVTDSSDPPHTGEGDRNTEVNQNSQPKQLRAMFGQEEKAIEERNSQTQAAVSAKKAKRGSTQLRALLITCNKQHPCLLSPSHRKELSPPAGWNTLENGRGTCIQKSEVITYTRCLLLVT